MSQNDSGTDERRPGWRPKDWRPRGFRQASGLVGRDLRAAAETRGFAVSRLLTHWTEIAGPDLAALCRPVKVSYARAGLGGTLVLLVRGADAPVAEMRKEEIRARVNACYGYAAISRVRLTQTAPQGFGEAPAHFEPAPDRAPDPEVRALAESAAGAIEDEELRTALAALAETVFTRNKRERT